MQKLQEGLGNGGEGSSGMGHHKEVTAKGFSALELHRFEQAADKFGLNRQVGKHRNSQPRLDTFFNGIGGSEDRSDVEPIQTEAYQLQK